VARAIKAKRGYLKALFRKRGLPYPPKRVLIRIFKQERALELWGQGADGHYAIVKSYPVCAASGDLGPKRRQGDLQVPEGFYHVRVFNPWSAYHLSLGINYPNKSDRLLGYRRNLGGAIMIHGDCVSIGCVAITDAMASEVYLAAAEARLEGKRRIPVHIFPTRLNEKGIAWLAEHYAARPELIRFWRGLKPGYDHFERHRTLPRIQIDRKGRYVVRKPKRRAGGSSVKTAGKTTQTL
jgi:murein L,D-transpeptidase YafK